MTGNGVVKYWFACLFLLICNVSVVLICQYMLHIEDFCTALVHSVADNNSCVASNKQQCAMSTIVVPHLRKIALQKMETCPFLQKCFKIFKANRNNPNCCTMFLMADSKTFRTRHKFSSIIYIQKHQKYVNIWIWTLESNNTNFFK